MKNLLPKAPLYIGVILTSLFISSCENESVDIESSTALENDFTKIVYNGKTIDVQKLDDHYLWGDILIPISATKENSSLDASGSQKNSIIADQESLWPNSTIPYFFDPNFGNFTEARVAIHHWNLFTTLNFVESTNQADDDLIVFQGSGCNATVGYRGGRHENSVSIGNVCDYGDAIHEFGHAIGLYHEHNRNDRDDYVEVFFDNMIPSFHSQFEKNEHDGFDSHEFTPFDFNSTMMFSSDAFSIEGRNNSMLRLNGTAIRRSEVLSEYDIQGVESVYRDGSPKRIAISALINGGKYISSENGRREITSNRSAIGAWETFTVHPIGGGLLALQGNNRRFLSVDENGVLKFSARTVGDSERFKFTYGGFTSNGKIYYNISHEDFSTLSVNDFTNELTISSGAGGGQDTLFAVEIL